MIVNECIIVSAVLWCKDNYISHTLFGTGKHLQDFVIAILQALNQAYKIIHN